MRILFAEDEEDLNAIVTRKLTEEGFLVDSCFDGREALEYMETASYDAVVLDVMMPGADGFEVLKKMRMKGDGTPVLFLTARDAVSDRIRGLNSGANDYIIKPFSLEELVARIRAATRSAYGISHNILTAGSLTMDVSRREVTREGRVVSLTAKEYQLLEYLMYNKGIVLSRSRIEDHIWNYDYEGGTNVVDVYIRYLRKKIDDGYEQKLIHTVRGAGYVLREDV
ncbi:MAG: response regulator transcription factor [Lachnospiraceae bacterium]|nr:response regulator transcription factor [Lachnospiraceae bacterium]